MKKLSFIVFFLIGSLYIYGQSSDSLKVAVKPLTEIQRDSLLISIEKNFSDIAHDAFRKNKVGRYKVYRTSNIYNSLKLDTATGRATALQIGINDDKARGEYLICGKIEDFLFTEEIIGRYALYPTGNNYNFILIDTILGSAYQVQWSTKSEQCGRWRIW